MWIEPTRRLPFSPRFSYDARYGASLTALVLGGYLLLNANVAQLAIGLGGISAYTPDQMAFFVTQYLFAIAVVIFAFAMAPATSGRRIIAVVVALVLIVLWTVMFTARLTGAGGPLPFATGFLTAQSFIVPLVTATGWLIVRERPGVTYLALLLTLAGGAIPFALVMSALPGALSQLITVPLAGILAIGIAWIARAIHAAIGNHRAADALVDAPPAA